MMKAPASTGGLFLHEGMGDASTGSASPPSRGESMAYPKQNSGCSRIQWYIRQNSHAVLATAAFLLFVVVISSDVLHDSYSDSMLRGRSDNLAGAVHKGYFSVESSKIGDNSFRFAALTDLDQLSLVKDERKPTYRSVVLPGVITYNPTSNKYTLKMEPTRELRTHHNEAGRGAEFSELTVYNNRLLTFDDRTGEVFEILNNEDGKSSYVVPRLVLTEGPGDTDKGMKWEWATVKDGELYLGSMGKEYTRSDGSIANRNNLWISVLSKNGDIRRQSWERQYNFVRNVLGANAPGYLIHEAINWSPHLKKWVFAPRRISSEVYDDVKDEHRGSNKIVLIDEHFTTAQVVSVNMASKDGLHGFSSFAFVPGTKDQHALALRSVEEDCAGDDLDVCKQRSYLVIFDVTTGEVLLDEQKIDEPLKYEGVEFVDIYTTPPKE